MNGCVQECNTAVEGVCCEVGELNTCDLSDKAEDALEKIEDQIKLYAQQNASMIRGLFDKVMNDPEAHCAVRSMETARNHYMEYIKEIREVIAKQSVNPNANTDLDGFIERDQKFIEGLYADENNPKTSIPTEDAFKEVDALLTLLKDLKFFEEFIEDIEESCEKSEQLCFLGKLACVSVVRYSAKTFSEICEIVDTIKATFCPAETKPLPEPNRFSVFKPADLE